MSSRLDGGGHGLGAVAGSLRGSGTGAIAGAGGGSRLSGEGLGRATWTKVAAPRWM
jgi:hypothetical protein